MEARIIPSRTTTDAPTEQPRHALTFSIVAGLIALALLHVLGRFDFYLSHTFSELFAISVAWALFLIVWNTRRQVDNDAFVFLGTALFFIGVIDLVHALGYQGNRFISLQGVSDASVQLWLAGRGLQSLAFLAFPLLLNRRFNQRWSLVGFSILTVLILLSIFHWKIFPTCYVPDTGATPFKWTVEGVIIVLYASALWLLHDQRQYLDGEVYVLFAGAIGFMVPAQFASAFYNPRYEWLNLLGHDFKLASFFMVYLALIRSGLQRPYAVLFHKLDASARALMDANIERTTILDHQPDHILLHDLDQRILWANQAVCAYVGKPREAIMGARCQEIWRQSGSTCQDCPVKKSIADGTIESIVIRTPDGTAWQVRTCPVRDANGLVTRILEIRENITERLRPLDALRLSEEKFSKAFHWNSTLMTISSLEDGIYDEVNEASLRATGLTREAVIGRSSTEMGIISQADRKKLLAVLKHHGSVKNLPLTLMPQRPNPLQVLYSAEVITINGQKKLLSMAQDVTALVQTQQELDQERSLLIESKRMLQTILDGIPDIIGLQETDHTIIAYNKAGYDLLGLTPEAVRGKKCYELLGYRYSCDHCATTKALASGRIETIERYEPALDRWFKVNAIPIFGADGAISMIVEQLHEITAERKKEVQLRRLGSAIHQVAEAVLITDGSGTIEYVNPAFEAITGYSRAEAVGRTPRILKSGHHGEAFYGDLWDTITAGRTWHGRMVNRKKNGTVYHEAVSISPVFDQQGTIVNFVAVKRDITEQLDLEEHLRQAQKMEAIGALAGGIAHDFNNILFPLVGFAEMLQEDLPPESPLQDHVDEILRASTRARELVQQILAFSRQAKQEKKAIRIQTIVKEVIKLCRASLPSTITIDARVDNLCRSVVADPTQIHQVAMNLITNAFHAMEETGGTLRVAVDEVECEPSDAENGQLAAGTYVCLSVSDTGCGIDPAIRDKIFMPYFTTKDKNKGTGMGLAVVLGVVQSHGGDIQLKSTPGQGTEINAYFPCHAREADDDAQATTDPIPRGHERILLVDDEAPIVRMMRQKLERLGYGVTARTSSIEALEVFNAQPDRFDLVISDVTMPNMTGLQLALEIKRTRPRMPIVLCTGYSEQFDRQRIKTLGIQGVVLKPVVTRELANEIRAVLDTDDPPGATEASNRL